MQRYIAETGSCGGSRLIQMSWSHDYEDATSVTDIKGRIGQEKQVTRHLHSTLWRNQLRP